MITNRWNSIVEWFRDRKERNQLIQEFNISARNAFILGSVPTLIKASISKGEPSFRHQFSNWRNTGLRIQAFKGSELGKSDLIQIGDAILDDQVLIRRLIVLGFDTLEVHGDVGQFGCRWQIKEGLKLISD